MSDVRLEIAQMAADHHREAEAFERQQKLAIAHVLQKVCEYLEVPSVTMESRPGDEVFLGIWRVSDILAAARSAS